MAKDDKTTVPDFVNTYLINGLGTSADTCHDFATQVRSAWGLISTTAEGSILAHIAKCVDISLQAQAKPFIITSINQYIGTAILGSEFTIYVELDKFEPMETPAFEKTLVNVDSHSAALQKIIEVASLEGDDRYPATMRHLRHILISKPLQDDERKEILSQAVNLSFIEEYWSFNSVNLENTLNLLIDPTQNISIRVPMNPEYLLTLDRYEEVLSAFGVNAPSFNFPGTTRYAFGEKPFKDLNKLVVKWLPVPEAINELKRVILEKCIYQPRGNIAQANATIRVFSDKKMVNDLKEQIIKLSGFAKEVPEAIAQEKVEEKEESVDFF